ncbi:MAG: nuclear transport factor 2 family protein [Chitinophagaceae bacterium]|nr:MAG: nuclear transport factor 2 family protein [Chitinophagaceae bacterium]
MEQVVQSAETVFQHHIQALLENDLEELLKDYTEDSVLLTPSDSLKGITAISNFYSWAISALPKGQTQLELLQQFIVDDKVFIVWKAESPFVSIPIGGDTFDIKSGKIVFQSVVVQIIQKS